MRGLKKSLCLEVERRWLLGRLESFDDLSTLAREVLASFEARFPSSVGRRETALGEITNEILRVRRALTYGGRAPAEVAAPRQAFVLSLDPLGLRRT